MKKIIVMLTLLLPVISKAQMETCIIKLDVDTVSAKKAYLIYKVGEQTTVDSPNVVNGKAMFEVKIPYPVSASLSLDNKGYGFPDGKKPDLLSFYLEKGTIEIKTHDLVKNAVITGSKMNKELAMYNRFVKSPMDSLEDFSLKYHTATAKDWDDTTFRNEYYGTLNKILPSLKERQAMWIKTHPDTYVSLKALNWIAGSTINVPVVEPLYNSLSARLRNSVDGKELGERIAATKAVAVGSMAPVFTMNDVNGAPVKLTDFRGKYVLIDFWASWCGPCRAENPNYKKAYAKYKDRNFTILGVSLDAEGKKDAWVGAIKKDGLEWTQVSDLKYWNNEAARMYDVKAIPQNFLVDPSGKIIAKNMRGEELQEKLATILPAKS